MAGFDIDFDTALETRAVSVDKPMLSRKYQERAPLLGQRVTFAKAGVFEIKMIGKGGKEIKRYPTNLQVVILDAKFGRQNWVEDANNKFKTVCSTISHSIKDKAGVEKVIDGGWWQLPYSAQLTNERYNPIGAKTRADGTQMSCADCMAAGDNEGCRQTGMLYVAVLGMTNEDDEMIPLAKPMLLTLSTPMASGYAFQMYATKRLRETGYKPSQVITTLGITKTTNGLANMLTMELEDKLSDKLSKECQEMFVQGLTEFNEEQTKQREEWQKNRDKANANKPYSRANSTKEPAVDNEFDF